MFKKYLFRLLNILDFLDLENLTYTEEKNGCLITAKKANGEIKQFFIDKKLKIIEKNY